MEIRQELDDQKGLAENYTQIGEVYLAQNRNEQAINFFRNRFPLPGRKIIGSWFSIIMKNWLKLLKI